MRCRRHLKGFILGLALTLPVSTYAGTLGPRRPSELVTLIRGSTTCPGGSGKLFDQRQLSDGTTETFVIPEGQVFIITSADFGYYFATPNSGYIVRLFIKDPSSPTTNTVLSTAAATNAGGNWGGSFMFPTGIAVKSGFVLCDEFPSPLGTVHGYFTKDR